MVNSMERVNIPVQTDMNILVNGSREILKDLGLHDIPMAQFIKEASKIVSLMELENLFF